jgi:peptide/nickel transport system permease protein
MKSLLKRRRRIAPNTKYNQFRDVWFRLRKNRTAMVGLTVIVIIVLLAVSANLLADYQSKVLDANPLERLQGPSLEHLFGTDALGRDLFARIIHGARYSLAFAFVCTFFSIVGGVLIGATAAYMGGRVDNLIMRVLDAFMCLPGMLLSLSLVSALGVGLKSIIIALSISMVPSFARVVRSVVLTVVRQEYIEAAKACGMGHLRIILGHVIPNAVGIIIVNATMNMAGLIMSAASLSFIGMGIQPPAPEWGAMLSEGQLHMRTHPHMVLVPGLAIVITALSFNLLGDGLSEALDPRMKD